MLSARARLIIAAMLLGPILLYWGLGLSPSERRTAPPAELQQGQDYFAIDIKTREFSEDGALRQQFSAPRLDHYPQHEASLIKAPTFLVIDPDGSQTSATADRAIIPDTKQKAVLAGDVRVQDNAMSGASTRVLTEKLTLYPERNYAETSEAVTIISDGVRYKAVGMEAAFKERKLKLLSNVQGIHENDK